VTTPGDYGISPEVFVLAEAADRQADAVMIAADRHARLFAAARMAADRQARQIGDAVEAADRRARQISDAMEASTRTQRFLANVGPVMRIIERQQNAMEAMRSSFELAMRVQPLPATQQALADVVRRLREDPPAGVALAAQARAAEPALLAFMGQELTPEQIDEVQQGVEEIEADPELSGKLRRLAGQVDWSGIGTLTPWAALCIASVLLFKVADLPVTEQLSAAQSAALANWFQVLAVVTALAAVIVMMQKK
jgi:hypothetical protein